MNMNANLTISEVLERAEEQMTMANLAGNTCKALSTGRCLGIR